MAGTYRKRGNSFLLEYMCKGQRYYKTILASEIKKEKDIELLLAQFVLDIKKGNYVATNYTFYEFSQIWLVEVVKPNCSELTLKKYIINLNNRILPFLGSYKIQDINILILTNFFNQVKASKTMFKNRENKEVTRSTVEKVYNIVNAMLEKAFEFDVISNNPCKKIKLQFKNKTDNKIHYYDRETYNTVLELLKKEDFNKRVLIELALKTGLRRSEIFGLTWDDIDLGNKTLHVNKSRQLINKKMKVLPTKTLSSIRTISIPNSLYELLKEYKTRNKNNIFLFENININSICAWFRNWQKKNNLPVIRFHDLRHTHATLLLLQGVDLKTISKRLGHSDIGRTMNTYTHVLKELDVNASKLIDEL